MYDPYHPQFRVQLEAIAAIPVTITLMNYEVYQIISSLENNALDERIDGKIDDARRIAKLIVKIEKQMEMKD